MEDRKQGLDLLRAIAIILVLFHHFDIVIDATDLKKAWFYPIVMGGWVGVDLFFVLSGFLVSGLLIKEKIKYQQINYGRFLIRRLLKIYPAYYFFTIITFSFWYISGVKKLPISNVLGELFFIQNYTGSLWRHTWSLAVEEHFYLFLCLIMPWLIQTKKTMLTRGLIAYFSLATLCFVFRYAMFPRVDFIPLLHQFPTHLRIDSLMLGVLLQICFHSLPNFTSRLSTNRSQIMLLLLGSSCILPVFFCQTSSSWISLWGFNLFAIGAACLVCSAISWKTNSAMNWLSMIGKYSYSIYLWHMVAGGWITSRLVVNVQSLEVKLAIYFAISIAMGFVAAKFIEFPFLLFRDKRFPSAN